MSKAFLQVVGLTYDKLVGVNDQKSADIVLLEGEDDLRTLYNEKQIFCVLQTSRQRFAQNQPENVCILDTLKLFEGDSGIALLLAQIDKYMASKTESATPKVEIPRFSNIATFKKSYTVLIVDDSGANLSLALTLLAGQQILPVTCVEDAVRYLRMEGKTFDAVLTDMHMKPDKTYGSLNLNTYGIKETIPFGFAIMLEATARGIPVAVVTDANHHHDWVSAMFDHIKSSTVNGQKVLFFNNIGKRWDKALKCLME